MTGFKNSTSVFITGFDSPPRDGLFTFDRLSDDTDEFRFGINSRGNFEVSHLDNKWKIILEA
jgi:hypothetical protein